MESPPIQLPDTLSEFALKSILSFSGDDKYAERSLRNGILSCRYNRYIDNDSYAGLTQAMNFANMVPQFFSYFSVKKINFAGTKFGPHAISKIINYLHQCPDLVVLDLQGTIMGYDGAVALSRAIPSLTKLIELNINSSHSDSGKIRDAGAIEISKTLSALVNLADFSLSGNGLTSVGMTALAPSLATLKNLRRLILSSNYIDPPGAIELSKALPSLEKLNHLDISWCHIGNEGLLALMANMPTDVEHINIGRNNVTDILPIVPCFARLTTLRELILDHNKIGPAGGVALSTVLHLLAELRSLNLDATEIADPGCQRIISTVSPTLSWFKLTDNCITDASIEAILGNLRRLPKLYVFSIGGLNHGVRNTLSEENIEKIKAINTGFH